MRSRPGRSAGELDVGQSLQKRIANLASMRPSGRSGRGIEREGRTRTQTGPFGGFPASFTRPRQICRGIGGGRCADRFRHMGRHDRFNEAPADLPGNCGRSALLKLRRHPSAWLHEEAPADLPGN